MPTPRQRRVIAFLCSASFLTILGCAEYSGIPGFRDLPRERGFSPSVVEEQRANLNGENLTAAQARARVDNYTVSSRNIHKDWPVDEIAYKRFSNAGERSVYVRRALGRFAFIKAKEQGLGTALDRVRRAARVTAPTTAGEWWTHPLFEHSLVQGDRNVGVTLPNTINAAIQHSQQIKAFGDLPAIRGTAISEAEGRFTPEFFAEARQSSSNSRATSAAIAGGAARVTSREQAVEAGVRSRLKGGGEVTLAQRVAVTDTNRTSYIPGKQTESEAVLSYIQPLLRESGRRYSDSPREIANMDTQIAVEEYRRQSESHLLEVERSYWNLYVARAVYLQTQRLARRGQQLASQLDNRSEIDADQILINRARSLAERWSADVRRSRAALDNAEYRLAALINHRSFGPQGVEILPKSAPNGASQHLTVNDTIDRIFLQRPELQQVILQYQAALLREGVSANEALPELDLVLEATLNGGADGRDISGSISNQGNGQGYLVGLKFAVPLGFDERDARYKRRRIETIQQERQVLSTISTILLEVDVSANEYIVACNDLVSRRKALLAAQRDVNTLRNRWDEGVGDGGIGLMSALLSSYEDLQDAEQAVATARATREIASANLARSRGVLLDRWGLKPAPATDVRNEPTYKLTSK